MTKTFSRKINGKGTLVLMSVRRLVSFIGSVMFSKFDITHNGHLSSLDIAQGISKYNFSTQIENN